MNTESNCEQYQDTLDNLAEKTATADEIRRLRDHARTCSDCTMLLEMHEQLASPSMGELESRVPDHLVEGMWPRVESEIMKGDRLTARENRRRPIWRWVAAVQAAAIVLLAGAAAFLFVELRDLRLREATLAEKVTRQEQHLTALDWRTSRDGSGIESASSGGLARLRRLATVPGGATVAEITQFLERLPEDSQVLGARDANRLITQLPYAVSGDYDTNLDDIDTEDGLQAGEALRIIAALNLDPSQQFPAGRVREISKRYD